MTGAAADPAPLARATNRLAYIDAVRGFAALWVFLLHIHGYWLDNVRPPTLSAEGLVVKAIAFGGAGVDIFIVLSGFCLTLPLLRGGRGELSRMHTRGFFRRRAYRLLPAYFAALFLVMLIELIPSVRPLLVARDLTWTDLVTHVTLTFPFFGETLGSVNGSLWSISLEATLYLGFPVLLLLHRWRGMRAVILTTLGVAALWAVFTVYWRATGAHPALPPEPDKLFPARWVQFALGMWAATVVRHPRGGELRWALPVLVVAAPVGVASYVLALDLPALLAWGLVGAALLITMSAVPSRFFSRGPLRWLTALGVISYSFYLLHQPILLLTSGLADLVGLGLIGTLLLALATAGTLTVVAASLFFHGIEKPFLVRGSMRAVVLPAGDQASTVRVR